MVQELLSVQCLQYIEYHNYNGDDDMNIGLGNTQIFTVYPQSVLSHFGKKFNIMNGETRAGYCLKLLNTGANTDDWDSILIPKLNFLQYFTYFAALCTSTVLYEPI